MKTPPFLLFTALLFWGWQSHLLWAGLLAGGILELSRFVRLRWELEDVDFNRIWSFCVVLVVALAGYFLTQSNEGAGLAGVVRGTPHARDPAAPNLITLFRWLPLIFLPFLTAQAYNLRNSVPLTAVSMVLRLRRRRGERALAGRYVDVSYAYFIVCIFSASIHPNEGTYFHIYSYFFGECVLILWGLWTLRSGRFGVRAWVVALAVVIALGFVGQIGIGELEHIAQNFNAQFLARLMRGRTDPSQSITSMGQIGDLKLSPRIVIRLKPGRLGDVPDYLREASYRNYSPAHQLWAAGSSLKDFMSAQPEPDGSTWILLSNKTAHAVVNISCYLEGRSLDAEHDPQDLLPLPSGVCRLENLPLLTSVISLQTNKAGAVMATGFGLMNFDARFGPGPTFDSRPDVAGEGLDYNVPPEEVPALNQVIAEMNLPPGASELDKRAAVATFFTRNFTYSTWRGRDKLARTNETALARFLLTSRSGHCEYFASATVLLLRQMGIPARYAVGYFVHETSHSGYVVRERDAHAWCLAWNGQAKMWQDFDTTPASWTAIEGRNASFTDAFSDAWSWIVYEFQKFRWRQANLRNYILWTLTPVMAVLVYYIIFQRRTKSRPAAKKTAPEIPVIWPGHDSVFYQLEQALATRGLERQPQEAQSDWLERALQEPALANLRAPLRQLLQLHYRYRFDPPGLNDDEKKLFGQNAETVLGTLARMKPVNSRG